MRYIKQLLCILTVLCLVACMAPFAFAQDVDMADDRFAGKTWEEVVEEFLTQHGTDFKSVAMGYYNTVTGEEHYWNGDQYMVSGSMFKVPLNMYFTEKIYKGEMNWDSKIAGVTYDKLLEWTIVNSDNTFAEYLWRNIGSYRSYRIAICPYMGVEAETVEDKYYENNFFTPEQMIHCLKLLYTEQERFPGLIDMMLLAEPENYFKYNEQEFEIAHKYGYLAEGWKLYMNDCAIAYTDDPIVFVMFTDTISQPYETMTEFCTLMCDYAQYHTALRLEQQARENEEAALKALETARDDKAEAEASILTTNSSNGVRNIKNVLIALVLAFAVIALAISLIVRMLRYSEKGKINGLWGTVAILLAAAALLMSILGMTVGTLIARPSGDPTETVTAFMDAIEDGNYQKAYSYLSDYETLGLEKQAEGEVSLMVQQALRDSYSYKLHGDCVVDGLHATQLVLMEYLDLAAVSAELEALTNENLAQIVESLPRSEIYDENDNYLPEVTNEAYKQAVEAVLSHAADYYNTAAVELELNYRDGQWQLNTNQVLLDALMGGSN